MKRLIPLVPVLALFACASNEPQPQPAPPAKTGKLKKWSELSHDEEVQRMKEVVKPQMAALFKEYDAEVYKAVGCKTCHGAKAKENGFHMPNPDLPKLDPTDDFKVHAEADAKTLKFMQEKVTPKMVELLNIEPWSPKNPKGFGCFSCHTRKQG